MSQAFIDVSEVLLSPDMADSFQVTRRPEVVVAGRSTVPNPVTTDQIGVVTMASPNDLLRLEDNDRMDRTISIVTKARLQGPAQVAGTNFKPDLVVWRGDTYVVKSCEPYPQFGAGFVQALAGSWDSVDEAPSAM